MKSKIQLFAVFAGACLTSGCIVPAPYYDRPVGYGRPAEYDRPVEYGRPVAYAAPLPPEEIILPEVIIVEGGVRHDRCFYQRHPEYYRRDQLRYPERFAHRPTPRRGSDEYRRHVPPP